jgi:hypothetical protein
MRTLILTFCAGVLAIPGTAVAIVSIPQDPAQDRAPASPAPSRPTPVSRRDRQIRECTADLRNELPRAVDVAAFCTCTVDRIRAARVGIRPGMEYCATVMDAHPH